MIRRSCLIQNHSLDYWSFVAGFETKNPPPLFSFFKSFWLFWVPQTSTPILKLATSAKKLSGILIRNGVESVLVWICIDFEWFSVISLQVLEVTGSWSSVPAPTFLCKHLPHLQAPVLDPDEATHCAPLVQLSFFVLFKSPFYLFFYGCAGPVVAWASSGCGDFSLQGTGSGARGLQWLGHVGSAAVLGLWCTGLVVLA